MTTQTHLNTAKAKTDVELLRADLGAERRATIDQLLERTAERVGRPVFTVPQARAALAELGQAGAAATPTQRSELAPHPGVKVGLRGLRWDVLPWHCAGAELPHGVASLLERCGRTLFRTKTEPRLYLVADYDPDVARLLAQGVPDIKGAALRGVRNLLDEVGQAEWELERPGAAPSGGDSDVD